MKSRKHRRKSAKAKPFHVRQRELAEDAAAAGVTFEAAPSRAPTEQSYRPNDELAALRERMAAQEAELRAAYEPADTPLAELDDTGYQPTRVDPLRRGAARVTDITAKAAARRKATTKHEYDQQQRRTS